MAVAKMYNDNRPNAIQQYFHCRQCMEEKPANQSMARWCRIHAGVTEKGLQVWCARHNRNIALLEWAEPSDKYNNPNPLPTGCAMCGDKHE